MSWILRNNDPDVDVEYYNILQIPKMFYIKEGQSLLSLIAEHRSLNTGFKFQEEDSK